MSKAINISKAGRIVLTFGKITSPQEFGKYRKDETSKKGKREVKVTKVKKKI